MRNRWGTTLGLLLLFCALMGGSAWLQHHHITEWRKRPFQFRDALYLPSSGYVKAVAVGYDKFVADFLWLRMIQTFAAAWTVPECAPQLMAYFRVITDLDPKFLDPYSFAILGVGEEGRRYEFVKEVIDKSIIKAPGNSKVTYEGAFFANWTMNDQELAKYYVRMAKLDPNYPPFVDRWEGYFDLKQGRYRAAFEKYLTDYLNAIVADNSQLYDIVYRNLHRTMDQWFISEIKNRAIEWKKEKGSYPTVEELDAAGRFNGVELPDVGMVSGFTSQLLKLPARERSQVTETMIQQFANNAVKKFPTLPVGPYVTVWPAEPGYVIWSSYPEEHERFVMSQFEAHKFIVESVLPQVTEKVEAYKTLHGGQCPPTLHDVSPELEKLNAPDGKPWAWDPVQCTFGTTKYPNLSKLQLPPW